MNIFHHLKHVHVVGGEDVYGLMKSGCERLLKLATANTSFYCKREERKNNFSNMSCSKNLNLHHCVLCFQRGLETAESVFMRVTEISKLVNLLWQEHHQLVKTCLTIKYLTTLSSDVHWKISHMHPVATSTFKQSWFILSVIWKTSKVFFASTSKPPRRGWLHGIHHHASLMTSGQEHGVKSQ